MPVAYLTSKKPGFMRVYGTLKNPKQKYYEKDAGQILNPRISLLTHYRCSPMISFYFVKLTSDFFV